MSEPIRFYQYEGPVDAVHLAKLRTATPDHISQVWRPGGGLSTPPGCAGRSYRIYAAFHHLRVFGNRDYSALVLSRPNEKPDHVSSVFPRFFRFPFMAKEDIQIGATHTLESARGQGLARRAILEILAAHAMPGRKFWYLTEAKNTASCSVIEGAGFSLFGVGAKEPGLALKLISVYRVSEKKRHV